jgi:putative oxidoreductase
MKYAVLAGRQLFSVIFIMASARHFSPDTIGAAAPHGVPLPDLLVPVTMMLHNFWAVSDPMTLQVEKAMFLKNVTMLGAALVISYFGAGPLSMDALFSRKR